MSELSIIQKDVPWLTTAGVVVDPIAKTATVTGAATLFTRKYTVARMSSISFNVQSSGGSSGVAPGAGTPATAWKIFAANDYDDTRPNVPGTFVDVTADFGAVGVSTPPGTRQFGGAFSGASQADRFAAWVCPWGAVQFQLVQASGTGIYLAQFFAAEI